MIKDPQMAPSIRLDETFLANLILFSTKPEAFATHYYHVFNLISKERYTFEFEGEIKSKHYGMHVLQSEKSYSLPTYCLTLSTHCQPVQIGARSD